MIPISSASKFIRVFRSSREYLKERSTIKLLDWRSR